MIVAGKVSRDPVQDDANAIGMQRVDQIHQVGRTAVPAGGGKIPDRLVAPTPGKRMLADRQEFDMRVPHVVAVLDQLRCQFAVGQPIGRPAPLRRQLPKWTS